MKKQNKTKLARPYLRASLQGNRLFLVLSVFALLLVSALDVFTAVLLQLLMDAATGGEMNALLPLLALSGLLLVGGFLATLFLREVRTRYLRRASTQYKAKMFAGLTKKNISSFAAERTSTYISALTNDATVVEEKYFLGTTQILELGFLFFLGLAMMLWYSWKLTLVSIALSLLPVFFSVLSGGSLTKQEQAVSRKNEGFVAMVKDLLSGFPVIKSFQAEREAQDLFSRENDELEGAKFRRLRARNLIQAIASHAGFLMQSGVFIFGAYYAIQGQISGGVVLAFVQLMNYIMAPIQQLPELLASRKAAVSLVEKAAAALADHTGQEGGARIEALRDGIRCRDLRFGYEAGNEILRGIDLTFQPGKSYAIVGASGSGKSTLLNLLLGSWSGYQGSVTIGGQELRTIQSQSLYNTLSLIQQNVFEFDSTIAENITMFKDFPEEAIQDAVLRSGLAQLLAEKGRDYRCGENGCNLSGGERQRISIARCLLKKTQVLLMDEATAALDAQTAASVTHAILDVEGLTRIVVTHKLDAAILRRFDEIFVLRGGVIAEHGSFDALLDEKGYFHALYSVSECGE